MDAIGVEVIPNAVTDFDRSRVAECFEVTQAVGLAKQVAAEGAVGVALGQLELVSSCLCWIAEGEHTARPEFVGVARGGHQADILQEHQAAEAGIDVPRAGGLGSLGGVELPIAGTLAVGGGVAGHPAALASGLKGPGDVVGGACGQKVTPGVALVQRVVAGHWAGRQVARLVASAVANPNDHLVAVKDDVREHWLGVADCWHPGHRGPCHEIRPAGCPTVPLD